jgi:hypothetical protein
VLSTQSLAATKLQAGAKALQHAGTAVTVQLRQAATHPCDAGVLTVNHAVTSPPPQLWLHSPHCHSPTQSTAAGGGGGVQGLAIR